MRRMSLFTGALLSIALTAAGCATATDGDQNGSPDGQSIQYVNGFINTAAAEGDPRQGGTLSFGTYSEARSLDPTVASPSGSSGGTELANIYDQLLRFDGETQEFVPRLAMSLEPNDDFSSWTLKLREGVTFSDGTPFNAEAVVGSITYYIENRGTDAGILRANVAEMVVEDPTTLRFDLVEPWASFDTVLSRGAGYIVAPAAIATDTFQPIGAGPFVIERHAVQEELVLAAREDYWDGRPYLDKLRFVPLVGDEMRYDSMTGGTIDMAYLRSPEQVERALDNQSPGYMRIANLGKATLINQREGRPGEDPRIREAITLAIEPELIYQRVFDGAGLPYKGIFGETSAWQDVDAGPLPTDLERAEQLVNEAKADGFDGKITYVDINEPAAREEALTMKSMLDRVGFEVEIDYAPSTPDYVTRLFVDADFDVSKSSLSITDEEPYLRFYTVLSPDSPSNASGYSDDEMNQLLDELKMAANREQQAEAIGKIVKRWHESFPAVPVGPTINLLMMQENVHGVTPSSDAVMLFDKAWLAE